MSIVFPANRTRVRPSVELLLIRAADALESHLTSDPEQASGPWCRETINGLRAISLLTRVWIDVDIRDALERLRAGRTFANQNSLPRAILASIARLDALIGMSELQIGGLDPDSFPEDTEEETILGLRLAAWRIVAAIAVLHAFLCLLRRRESLGAAIQPRVIV
jgi:hypothetical protein